jgi:hypothetical protein
MLEAVFYAIRAKGGECNTEKTIGSGVFCAVRAEAM